MTPERAAELLPVITAFAEGKTIQVFSKVRQQWETVLNPTFNPDYEWRIKPNTAWYRVALMDVNCAIASSTSNNWTETDIESEHNFVRWLTDRIEYEV